MPAPTPPKTTSPSWMLSSGTRPASGMKLSCMELTAPHEASVVTSAKSAVSGMPKRTSLPSMLPPDPRARDALTPSRRRTGLPRCSKCADDERCPRSRSTVIAANTAQPWRRFFTISPSVTQSAPGMAKMEKICDEVRERRRVLARVGAVGVEVAAAVRAQHLDRLLRGDRAAEERLRRRRRASSTSPGPAQVWMTPCETRKSA